MPLGLVSYGDSDDSDGEDASGKTAKSSGVKSSASSFPVPTLPAFQKSNDPKSTRPLFPVPNPATRASSYSKLGLEKDQSGRVKITAPRFEDEGLDDDDEDDRRKFKKPKSTSSTGGLFSVLPQPQGPVKKAELNAGKTGQYDQLFARKKESGIISETIRVPNVNTVRFEAEQKKAEMINKFLKKDVDEPKVEEEQEEHFSRRPLPTAFDFQQTGNDREELAWEVDESAYEEDETYTADYSQPPPGIHSNPYDPYQESHQPATSSSVIQPGAVWTANYKYEDVQAILDNPQMSAPAGYKTDQQVHKLIARFEGPDFQEYLKGNQIEIVDFRADDHLGDARINVMKSLTDQSAALPARPVQVKGKVGKVSKQKGHITYLAAQAQARESELQNQWAKNKQTRQQTSAKYGF